MVPVSWPPWPGSITIRPIFNPSARMSERSPLAVGCASRTSSSAARLPFLRPDVPRVGVWIERFGLAAGMAAATRLFGVDEESLSSSSVSTTFFTGRESGFAKRDEAAADETEPARLSPGEILASSATSMLAIGAFPASALISSLISCFKLEFPPLVSVASGSSLAANSIFLGTVAVAFLP